MSLAPSRARLPASWMAAALVMLVARAAGAQAPSPSDADPIPAPGTLWNGPHVGFGVAAGPALVANDDLHDGHGFAVSARATAAMTMQVVHLELFYTHAELQAVAQGDACDVSGNSLGASVGVHPLFLANLLANRLGYVIASLYADLGVSAEFTAVGWRDQTRRDPWELGTHLGAGLDVPLDSADDGAAFWLGFQYRHSRMPSASAAVGADGAVSDDVFFVQLAYRINQLPFF
jgi:hypothetical protein